MSGFVLRISPSSLAVHLAVQPGAGVNPVALGGSRGDAQGQGGLLNRKAGEVAERDQTSLERVFDLELAKGFVQGEKILGSVILRQGKQRTVVELDPVHC